MATLIRIDLEGENSGTPRVLRTCIRAEDAADFVRDVETATHLLIRDDGQLTYYVEAGPDQYSWDPVVEGGRS
jgi:hypothetical protein